MAWDPTYPHWNVYVLSVFGIFLNQFSIGRSVCAATQPPTRGLVIQTGLYRGDPLQREVAGGGEALQGSG